MVVKEMKSVMKIFEYRITRLIAGSIYAFITAELFLRIFNPVPMLPRYIEAKSYGIRGNIGNLKYWHTTPDVKVQVRTNSAGMRADRNIPYRKPAGVKRIVVLGDSFGMGYEVDLKDTFLARMNEILRNSGINCETVNLSSSGYSNAEELIVLNNEGFRYEPDLVLLAWHASDLNENIRSNLFKLENGKLVRNAATYLPGVKIQEFLYRHPLCRLFTDNSHLFNWLRDNAGRKMKLILDYIRIGSKDNKNSKKISKIKTEELTLALLKEIKSRCDRERCKFMIFDIPTRRTRTEFVSVFPQVGDKNLNKFNYVNPLKKFSEYKGDLLYWERGHGHFTPEGCSLSGQVIAEFIIAHELL